MQNGVIATFTLFVSWNTAALTWYAIPLAAFAVVPAKILNSTFIPFCVILYEEVPNNCHPAKESISLKTVLSQQKYTYIH